MPVIEPSPASEAGPESVGVLAAVAFWPFPCRNVATTLSPARYVPSVVPMVAVPTANFSVKAAPDAFDTAGGTPTCDVVQPLRNVTNKMAAAARSERVRSDI